MRDITTRSLVLLLVTNLVSLLPSVTSVSAQALSGQARETAATNPKPILDKWEGPFGGVPPFDP